MPLFQQKFINKIHGETNSDIMNQILMRIFEQAKSLDLQIRNSVSKLIIGFIKINIFLLDHNSIDLKAFLFETLPETNPEDTFLIQLKAFELG